MRVLPVALSLMVLAGAAQAGVVLKMDAKDSSAKTTPFEAYYAQDGMLRVDSLDASGNVQRSEIVRDGVIWRISPAQRTYARIDPESIKAMFGGQEQRMEAILARLPPDKRAEYEARMEKLKHGSTDFAFTDTGKTDTVGKYSCRIWQETRTGKLFMEFCVVPAESLPDGADLAASMKKSLETVHQVLAGVPELANAAQHFTRMEKMGGFPARSRMLSPSGATESEHVLSSAQAQSLPADKFAVPQGYRQVTPGKEDQ